MMFKVFQHLYPNVAAVVPFCFVAIQMIMVFQLLQPIVVAVFLVLLQ